jgi:lysophospholipase L1-like esterase
VFIVLMILVEAAGQMYYRWAYGVSLPERSLQFLQAAHTSDAIFEQHPYLVAWPKSNVRLERGGGTISTTAFHTRTTGPAAPKPNAITVALVGGSTTFGTRLIDADSWPWILQQKLGDDYAVINYGVPGYTTAENIIQMALLVPESHAQIVVFYEGWNDLRNYHWPGLSPDYFGHGMSQFDNLIPVPRDQASFLERAARYSYVMQLLNRAFGTPVRAEPTPPSGDPDPEVDRLYARNLQTLKTLAHQSRMTALFVPQILNNDNYSKKGVSRSWTPNIEDAAVPALMQRLNGIMAQTCAPREGECQFVDEPLHQTWGGNDFIDEGHLSRQGGERLATILAARISRVK